MALSGERRKQQIQRQVVARLRHYFQEIKSGFLKALLKSGLDKRFPVTESRSSFVFEAALPEPDWRPLLAAELARNGKKLEPPLIAAISSAMLEGGTQLSKEFGIEFTVKNRAAIEYLNSRSATLIKGLDETTVNRMRGLLSNAADQGWGWSRTAEEIRQQFTGMSRHRAKIIAVQEVGQAFEEGNYQAGAQVQSSGVPLKKRWVTAGDDRVSDMDLENAAVGWIRFEDAYPSGHLHPLSHVGCRCVNQVQRDTAREIGQVVTPNPELVTVTVAESIRKSVLDADSRLKFKVDAKRDQWLETGNKLRLAEDNFWQHAHLVEAFRSQHGIGGIFEEEVAARLADRPALLNEWRQLLQTKAALQSQMSILATRTDSLLASIRRLDSSRVSELRKLVYVDKDLQTKIKMDLLHGDRKATLEQKAEWRRGAAEVSKMVSREIIQPRGVEFRPGTATRSYATAFNTVVMGPSSNAATAAHELGHVIEFGDQSTLTRSLNWLEVRTGGEELQSLAKFTGRNFEPGEMTRPDKFLTPYVGKDYGSQATEVLSVGLERMVTDPAEFARQDPDHFEFIINSARGIYSSPAIRGERLP